MFRPVMDEWSSQWQPAFYKFAVRLGDQHDRQRVINALKAEGVPADSGFRGFMRRALRRCKAVGPLDHATSAADRTVLIHHPILLGDNELLDQVVDALNKVDDCLG